LFSFKRAKERKYRKKVALERGGGRNRLQGLNLRILSEREIDLQLGKRFWEQSQKGGLTIGKKMRSS